MVLPVAVLPDWIAVVLFAALAAYTIDMDEDFLLYQSLVVQYHQTYGI